MRIGLADGRTVIREPVRCIVRSVSTDGQTDELIWGEGEARSTHVLLDLLASLAR